MHTSHVVDELVTHFQNASKDDCGKEFSDVLNTANKGIPNFDLFFQGKPYRKKFGADTTDRDRYNALAMALSTFAKDSEKLNKLLSNTESFFAKLTTFLQSDAVFSVMKDDFNKSYKTMAPKLAKLMKPSAGLNIAGSKEIFLHNFASVIQSENNAYLYTSSCIAPADLEGIALQYILVDHKLLVLNTSPDDTTQQFTSLWISNKSINNDLLSQVDSVQYTNMLYSASYDLNVLHFVSFDTLKRDMVAKSYDKLRSHVKLLDAKGHNLYAYKAIYKYSDGYNEFDENQIGNSISGFNQSYSDYTSNAMGSLVFNGSLGNVLVETYWLMTSEYVDVLRNKTLAEEQSVESDDDPAEPTDPDTKPAVTEQSTDVEHPNAPEPHTFFDWTPITIDEFISGLDNAGTLGRTYLH